MIKDGVQIETYDFSSADFLAIGRQIPDEAADVARSFVHMEHPSLSRKHAMLIKNKQTNDVFLYDHGSTHGTSLNYLPVKAFEFIEVNDGDILRFGESTRMFICHIDDADDEEEDGEDVDSEIAVAAEDVGKKETELD